jgi:predicted HTH domain antitoxin
MPLLISDDLLSDAGLGVDHARVEIACRLYDGGTLTLGQAVRWSQLTRGQFEDALRDRNLPVYRLDAEDLRQDLESLRQLGTPVDGPI